MHITKFCAMPLILPLILIFPPPPSVQADGGPGNRPAAQAIPAAQEPATLPADARFAVASIREYDPQSGQVIVRNNGLANTGEFYVEGWTLRMLIERAYGIQRGQVMGGPNWIDSLRFEIRARADDALEGKLRKLRPPQAVPVKQHMMQALLEDRFQLRIHKDTKELPGFALVVAKGGPWLGAPIADCTRPGGELTTPQTQPGEDEVYSSCSPLSKLADDASHDLARPVVDKTGLPGNYRYTFHYVPAPTGAGDANAPGEAGQPGSVLPDSASQAPSIFVALQEQLGLKLEARKVSVEVLVIDHVEHPTEN